MFPDAFLPDGHFAYEQAKRETMLIESGQKPFSCKKGHKQKLMHQFMRVMLGKVFHEVTNSEIFFFQIR